MKTLRSLLFVLALAAPAFGGVIGNPSEPQPPPDGQEQRQSETSTLEAEAVTLGVDLVVSGLS